MHYTHTLFDFLFDLLCKPSADCVSAFVVVDVDLVEISNAEEEINKSAGDSAALSLLSLCIVLAICHFQVFHPECERIGLNEVHAVEELFYGVLRQVLYDVAFK